MSKVLITEQYLTDIADAIREKHGTSAGYSPSVMATAISNIPSGGGGGDLPEEALVITGDCSYRFANGGWDWFINTYGDKITTKDITNANYMFNGSNLKNIPFKLNFEAGETIILSYLFGRCYQLQTVPTINRFTPSSLNNLFQGCQRVREIPEEFFNNIDWSYMNSLSGGYIGNASNIFSNCYSLRNAPIHLLSGNPSAVNSYSIYNGMLSYCYCLDEAVNIPFPHTATYTSNAFSNTFQNCSRLKNTTFALQEDGSPYVMKWKGQTIDLATYVGYTNSVSQITNQNSGITAETRITDDATYQLYKDHPDAWTTDINYSRYNHDSAVATINSLPDTSAYLATAGGTNTIKFTGASGALTDGGAINTLTEEEIAVATAKGWTVSLV